MSIVAKSTNIPETKEKPKLTVKQQAFICAYLQCFNAAKAARQAGYPKDTSKEVGYENLTKPYIAAEIHRRLDSEGITPARIKIALADIAFDGDVELHHRLSGLDKLAKINGMFIEKREITGQLDILTALKQQHGGATDDRLARAARTAGIDDALPPDGPMGDSQS